MGKMASSKISVDTSSTQLKRYSPFSSEAEYLPALIEEAKDTAKKIAVELKKRFGAEKVMLFGSIVHDDFHKWSDIDLAVWGIKPADFFKAVAVATGFSGVFKVDLVDAEDCSKLLLEHILREGVEL